MYIRSNILRIILNLLEANYLKNYINQLLFYPNNIYLLYSIFNQLFYKLRFLLLNYNGKKSLNKQIGGKSNNQRSLINCLKILIEDIELYADIKLLNYLKEITLKKQKKNYKFTLQIYSTLNYIIQRQKHKFSNLMIINFQQIQQQNKQIEIQTIDPNLVRNFRLMNFEKLKSNYVGECENSLIILYQGRKRLSKNSKIIFQCKLSLCFNLGTFSNHLIKVSKDPNYDLNPINKSFDEKFYKLSPDFILDEFKLLEDPKINQIFHFINYLMEQLIQILILLILQWIGVVTFNFRLKILYKSSKKIHKIQ